MAALSRLLLGCVAGICACARHSCSPPLLIGEHQRQAAELNLLNWGKVDCSGSLDGHAVHLNARLCALTFDLFHIPRSSMGQSFLAMDTARERNSSVGIQKVSVRGTSSSAPGSTRTLLQIVDRTCVQRWSGGHGAVE